jgi:hypothetical protein
LTSTSRATTLRAMSSFSQKARSTVRVLVGAGLVFSTTLAHLSCATTAEQGPPALATIAVVDEGGRETNLSYLIGKVVVLDVCAAWSDACIANATVFSRVCADLCGDDVELLTLLLDDIAGPARHSYHSVLEVKQRVLLPAPSAFNGESALGSLAGIPRVVFFNRSGHLVDDVSGAVISEDGLRAQIEKLR